MLTCLQCGYEWKSNLESTRPQCSKCLSTKNILSKDIPPQIKFKKEITELNREIVDLKNTVSQFIQSQKEDHDNLLKFELQVVHDIKDLLFWNEVLKTRTTPQGQPATHPIPEPTLQPIHRPIIQPKRNIHYRDPR